MGKGEAKAGTDQMGREITGGWALRERSEKITEGAGRGEKVRQEGGEKPQMRDV